MLVIENKVLSKSLMYKGNIILNYKINYPFIRGFDKFNLYNYNKAIKLKEYAETKLFEEAKEINDYNKQNGYPIMVYEVVLNYTITYNEYDILSLYYDEYIFSGGAHGNTIRTSQTWNMQNRQMLDLKDFYRNNPNYVSEIITQKNDKIKNDIDDGNNIYFEDYCCLTSSNFKVENYYLSKDGKIVIYYQQYDIAPYSSGIITFNIK